ncbi:LOW QUALITY PROTEIN: transmembrane protein 70, mitochondrial [Pseudophryne corroboree]|uniref:LOW QUALITY PROTEIN: transmembrane protein 70, mitochondrial n=1 Tax=Pseudophryne corroboree TaxID=495146 RepID=UPI003081BF6D
MHRFAVYGRCQRGLLSLAYRGPGSTQDCLRFLMPDTVQSRVQRSLLPPRQITVPDFKSCRFFCTSAASTNQELGNLVYTGNLARAVLGVKFFSYSTSMASLFILPVIMMKSGIGVDSLALKIAFFSVVGFFTFVTPVTLHFLTKGYVVRLYHNRDTDLYTAITYNAFLVEKRTVFSPEEVTVPGISKMFTTFYAKKKSMLVNPELFPNSWHYHHLMGYDKPFTFNPEELNPPSEEK